MRELDAQDLEIARKDALEDTVREIEDEIFAQAAADYADIEAGKL